MKTLRNLLTLAIAIILFSLVGVNAQTITGKKLAPVRSTEEQIFKKILALPSYSVFDDIKFAVNGDTVTLTGKVYSLGTANEAASVVKRVPEVKNVVNNITMLPPSPFDDSIRRQALRTFSANGLGGYFWENRPDVRIIVENGNLTLEGYVMNQGDYNALYIYARGLSNVFNVTNNLKIGKETFR